MNSQTRPPEDKILLSFLEQQQADAAALAAASDLVRLTPSNETPPRHYVAEFFCKGLVRGPDGGIREAGHFAVGIWFTPDYLRRVEPAAALTWLAPLDIWHPNILPPMICTGRIAPGTSLTHLLHQIYEVISFQKVTPREDDALNKAACAWVRSNPQRLPREQRPLKWRRPAPATGWK